LARLARCELYGIGSTANRGGDIGIMFMLYIAASFIKLSSIRVVITKVKLGSFCIHTVDAEQASETTAYCVSNFVKYMSSPSRQFFVCK